jgi:hypothetical protein
MNTDIGVIQKRSEPAHKLPRTIAMAESFAERIACRFLPSQLSVSRAELALAYEAPDQVSYYQNARVEIRPSVNIHDDFWFQQAPREVAVGLPGRQSSREARSGGGIASGFGETQAAALFERLFSRHKRVAALAPSLLQNQTLPADRKANQFATDSARRTEPVERIVSRPAASRPEESGVRTERSNHVAPSAAADPGWGSPSIPAPAMKPFTLPPGEVKRVTEQVIREIDHRIIARRERMGRR